MGFPKVYSVACYPKALQKTQAWQDERLTLVGNSWNVFVIAWLLGQLCGMLGLTPHLSLQQVMQQCSPGGGQGLQSFLLRPFMRAPRRATTQGDDVALVQKLAGLASLKGEDLLLQAQTEDPVRYHRDGGPSVDGGGVDSRSTSTVWSSGQCIPHSAGLERVASEQIRAPC